MDITQLMKMLGNSDLMDTIGKEAGISSSQVDDIIKAGIPEILGKMQSNAASADGADSLMKALRQHENDDLENMIKNPSAIDTEDGKKILGHIFGDNQEVANNIAGKTGADSAAIGNALSMFAPILMGMLGNSQKGTAMDSSVLMDMLSGASGGKGGILGKALSFLDQDKDGSIVDEVGGIIGGLFKK